MSTAPTRNHSTQPQVSAAPAGKLPSSLTPTSTPPHACSAPSVGSHPPARPLAPRLVPSWRKHPSQSHLRALKLSQTHRSCQPCSPIACPVHLNRPCLVALISARLLERLCNLRPLCSNACVCWICPTSAALHRAGLVCTKSNSLAQLMTLVSACCSSPHVTRGAHHRQKCCQFELSLRHFAPLRTDDSRKPVTSPLSALQWTAGHSG